MDAAHEASATASAPGVTVSTTVVKPMTSPVVCEHGENCRFPSCFTFRILQRGSGLRNPPSATQKAVEGPSSGEMQQPLALAHRGLIDDLPVPLDGSSL